MEYVKTNFTRIAVIAAAGLAAAAATGGRGWAMKIGGALVAAGVGLYATTKI